MALSPSIPTSFVPKQPVSPGKKRYSAAGNLFFFVSLIIGIIAIVTAGGVFLYQNYLTGVEKTKGAELTAAENNVSASTVEQFVELRDRLSASEMLVDQHVELSSFFSLLESITLQDVHFSSLAITVADDGSATINMTGVAKDFNALAAESTAFASQPNIQSAIFSGINVNANGTVAFSLNANLTPGLVLESAPPSTPAILSSASNSSSTPSFAATSTSPSTPPATSTGQTPSASTTPSP